MDCLKSETLLHRWIDGELRTEITQRLSAHIEKCPACREKYSQLQKLSGQLGSLPMHEPAKRMAESTLSAYRTRLPKISFQEWWFSLGIGLRTATCGIVILGFIIGFLLGHIPDQNRQPDASILADVYITAFVPEEGGVP